MKKTIASLSLFFCLSSCSFTYQLSKQCRVSTSIGSNSDASICIECYLLNPSQIDLLYKIMPKKWLKIAN